MCWIFRSMVRKVRAFFKYESIICVMSHASLYPIEGAAILHAPLVTVHTCSLNRYTVLPSIYLD